MGLSACNTILLLPLFSSTKIIKNKDKKKEIKKIMIKNSSEGEKKNDKAQKQ